MNKLLLAILIVTGCLGKPITAESTIKPTNAEVLNEIGDYTVGVVAVQGLEAEIVCSGVWIGDFEILTAAHCVYGIFSIEDGQIGYSLRSENDIGSTLVVRNATVEKLGVNIDLAIIKSTKLVSHKTANIRKNPIEIGESVSCVGHPKGLYWSYVFGSVSAERKILKNGKENMKGPFLQISAPIYYGNSGGGVFDKNGELLGIASFITAVPNVGFYVHKDAVLKFLNDPKSF